MVDELLLTPDPCFTPGTKHNLNTTSQRSPVRHLRIWNAFFKAFCMARWPKVGNAVNPQPETRVPKEHRIGRQKVKRGESFALIPNARFQTESDGARRKVCSCHTTERSPQFRHARRCPKKRQKGDITHARMCAYKITTSNLNSSEYTCLNFLIVFSSAGAHICLFRNRLIKPSCLQVSLNTFHSHRNGVLFW